MPRFVLLRHECPESFGKPSHWDFMLEWGDALRTWDLRQLPIAWANALDGESAAGYVPAIPLPDHRSIYLEFEGPLSGDRGTVHQCDRGTYEVFSETEDALQIRLEGTRICGLLKLEKNGEVWQLSPGVSTT